MTEQEAIKAALALKELCSLRGCVDGDYKCQFLDMHNKKKTICRISEMVPGSWNLRGLEDGKV